MQGFGYYLDDVSSVAVYGGNDGGRYDQEVRGMKLGADVLIATPGRLLSHLKVGNLDLTRCSFFVLDEADRMLDMGFIDDIMKIVEQLPASCQRIMFSATMPPKIRELAVNLLHDPVEVKIAVSKPAEKIRQSAYVCYDPQKLKIINSIFKLGDLKRVIIFSGKKERVKDIARSLKQMHINCGQMHSDLSQQERDEVMYRFKAGMTDVLVATDIVARGIDIDDIRIVINYDVPHDAEDYVHRIGRTARADRDGEAITFVNEADMQRFQQIEHFLGKEVTKNPLPEGVGDGPEYVKREKKRSNTRRHGRWHSKGDGSRNQGKPKSAQEGSKKKRNRHRPKNQNPS
jgi:superfamily II DNA/RNA helicase